MLLLINSLFKNEILIYLFLSLATLRKLVLYPTELRDHCTPNIFYLTIKSINFFAQLPDTSPSFPIKYGGNVGEVWEINPIVLIPWRLTPD